MKRVTIIVAYNPDRIIGDASGSIPWFLPEDLKFFKKTTMHSPCIMGRKTWESIPEKFRPLPNRPNYIVSRSCDSIQTQTGEEVAVFSKVESAIECSREKHPDRDIFIIGGGEIYKYCLDNNLVDRVIASEIKGFTGIQGVTFFPELSGNWSKIELEQFDDFIVYEYTPDQEKRCNPGVAAFGVFALKSALQSFFGWAAVTICQKIKKKWSS